MLRLFLPPNLAAAAIRDAIAVKAEIDLSMTPPPELLPALATLQRLGAKPAPVLFLQLTRAQLRELVSHLRGQPIFAWVNAPAKPLLWVGPILRGVSEHLAEPEPAAAPAASTPEPAGTASTDIASRGPVAGIRRTPIKPSSSTPLEVDGSEHYLAISLPSRESTTYSAAAELLKEHGFRLEPSNRKWWLRDRHKVLNFLAAHLGRLRDEFHAEFTSNFTRQTSHLRLAEISAEAVEVRDGYEVTVGLKAGRLADSALQAAVASGRGYVEDGSAVFLVDRERLAKVAAAQDALATEKGAAGAARRTHRIAAARVAEVQDVLEELAPGFQPPASWRARSEAMRDLRALPPAPIPAALGSLLRPYQRLGVAWLWYLFRHDLGGILADEMGLGKTLQALALLSALRAPSKIEEETFKTPDRAAPAGDSDLAPSTFNPPQNPAPSLVVCPASLVENWRREAARFAPQLRTFVHHAERRLSGVEALAGIDLVITSYATLARDESLFRDTRFCCVIADEAQHIKNRRTRNARALRALRADGRFLLTGTPLENSLEDLRSLFEFLMPGFLKPLPPGLRGDERGWHDERLRAQTAPYILRRTKAAVAPELPEKIEQVIYCDLEPAQAALYRKTHEESERALLDLETSGASENAVRMATLTQLLRLRQVCCDPRLIQAGRAAHAAESGVATAVETDGDARAASYSHSAKLGAFRELLDEALDEGHRLLVFSQFTSLLALLREELESTGITYAYLDGSMPPRERQAAVDRFQNDPSVPVFLLSLKAGGTGLNLTGADTVVHFDPWWNPAVEAQATDRAHRIGQTRVVTSYKLICSGTVEEKVLALQESKRALLADVFEASDAASARLNLDDLKSLLRG
jgi:superfamily II DNA or RNA helicase